MIPGKGSYFARRGLHLRAFNRLKLLNWFGFYDHNRRGLLFRLSLYLGF